MTRSAIVVAIEGLGTNMLGAYGGPWVRTPEIDTFASRGVVADQFLIDTDDLDLLYRSLLYGWHASEAPSSIGSSLPDWLATMGIGSLMVHDPSEELESAIEAFPISMEVEREEEESREVEEENWQESWMAECLASALGTWADDEDRPGLLWIHCKGWNGPWDAPYVYREALGGEDDPPPPRGIERPEAWFDAESDPDELFGWTQAAAAQVKLLDQAWEWIDATLEELGIADDCLVMLVGLGGYPLGEHNSVGPRLAAPYSERIHTPWIARFGRADPLGWRLRRIAQPVDLWGTLVDWFEIPKETIDADPRRRLPRSLTQMVEEEIDQPQLAAHPFLTCTSGGTALRLTDWSAVWHTKNRKVDLEEDDPRGGFVTGEPKAGELYLHPEDRWQQNDVASRADEVVRAMEMYRASLVNWLEGNLSIVDFPTIPDLLLERPV